MNVKNFLDFRFIFCYSFGMAKQKKSPYDKLSIILTPAQGKYLRKRADDEYRSVSSIIRQWLDREMAPEGQKAVKEPADVA